MLDRLLNVWGVLLGVLGLAILVALVVLGLDLRRARTAGPRWRRRLVATAIALLSAAGAYFAAEQLPPEDEGVIMCYAPRIPEPIPTSGPGACLDRLERRLELLDGQAAGGTIHPEACERALDEMRGQLADLAGHGRWAKLSPADRARAIALRLRLNGRDTTCPSA